MSRSEIRFLVKSLPYFVLASSIGATVIYSLDNRPPKYDPLLSKSISEMAPGLTSKMELPIYYDGDHAVVIVTPQPVPIGQTYAMNSLDIGIAIEGNEKQHLDVKIQKFLDPFWSERVSGVELLRFKVPDDVPMEELSLKITYGELTKRFLDANKFTDFMVIKLSDE